MPWEDKQLRDVREVDVRQLINSGVEEHLQLEYKSALYEGNDRGGRECLLDICMFANSGGGVLLIGVPERRDLQGQPTGMPDPAQPLGLDIPNPETVLQSYDARVVVAVEDRLPLESAAIAVGHGMHVLAIRVPNSVEKPHCVRYQGHVYFPSRRERHRYEMDVREIKEMVMRTASRMEKAEQTWWHFPPAAALITAGGRLMLAILQAMVEEKKGSYLLTDTDSILFVSSQRRSLIPCPGGPHKTRTGVSAVKAIAWKEVERICTRLNGLNPYDKKVVHDILKIEDCNYGRNGKPRQLYGVAISAKRYVVYARQKSKIQIIKPSEHGLGMLYLPDKRKRYTPVDCKDQKTSYPRWIVEAWERLLEDHFRNIKDPENALVTGELWFGEFPAVMRIRVTTPNVLAALRKHDPGAAKPYNFALSPILLQSTPGCTLVGSFSKHPKDWLTREYTEIHTGAIVRLGEEYAGAPHRRPLGLCLLLHVAGAARRRYVGRNIEPCGRVNPWRFRP